MKRLFTPEEIKALNANPNVYSANEHEIKYTNAFKLHFIERYLAGELPGQIFAKAGLPAALIGSKRIERACYRWKRAYENGLLGTETEQQCRTNGQKALMSVILEQRHTIQRLEKALSVRRAAYRPAAAPRRAGALRGARRGSRTGLGG